MGVYIRVEAGEIPSLRATDWLALGEVMGIPVFQAWDWFTSCLYDVKGLSRPEGSSQLQVALERTPSLYGLSDWFIFPAQCLAGFQSSGNNFVSGAKLHFIFWFFLTFQP